MAHYIDVNQTLYTITETYPETIDIFVAQGFPQMADFTQRAGYGKLLSLKAALEIKKINPQLFVQLLNTVIRENRENRESGDPELHGAGSELNTEAVRVTGLLPCPVRIPLMESYNAFARGYETETGLTLRSELKAASSGTEWVEEHIDRATSIDELPDLFISAGFDLFFDKRRIGRFREQKEFVDLLGWTAPNPGFADYQLRDPDGVYSIIATVPAVFLINTEELGERKVPTCWSDLFAADFNDSVSLPVGDFDLFNAILLTLRREYGDEAIQALGRSMQQSMHPSQMVKSDRLHSRRPAVTIMPYFFTKMVREGGTMQAVWPSDGAILSPIFMLAKRSKRDLLTPVVDFFGSRETGEILAHQGLFPSLNPEVDNRLDDHAGFLWLGWGLYPRPRPEPGNWGMRRPFQGRHPREGTGMNLVTVSGPPSSGKTAIILKTAEALRGRDISVGVAKFDCLSTEDDLLYEKAGIPVQKGLSGSLCPDHYFVSNIEEVTQWGLASGFDLLISESAGLCNRCSPYIKEIGAVCVIDNLSGINTPKKIGPMLKSADVVVITKGDIVSQAEREVFASRVAMVNPRATIIHVNGLTGQGAFELGTLIYAAEEKIETVKGRELRFPMPSALCSYCLGETRIGEEFQMGNIRKIRLENGNANN